jgi:hypothetical protein
MKKWLFLGVCFILLAMPNYATSVIGNVKQQNFINIVNQTGIDKNITYSFMEINDTHWIANFSILDGTSLNILSYKLVNLTTGINFQTSLNAISFNPFTQNGWFYIIFPKGFKAGEMAKFGYNSTIINTTTTTFAFYPSQRAICSDSSGYKHVVYNNGTDAIYTRSLNRGSTWTTTWLDTTSGIPAISCDGNNVVIGLEVSTTNLSIFVSANNGATFTTYTPRTTSVSINGRMSLEVRGNRIYVVYEHNNGNYYSVKFFNSTTLGTGWGDDIALWTGYKTTKPSTYDFYQAPTLAVVGSGTSTDKLFVTSFENDWDGTDSTLLVNIKNSSSSGTSWSASQMIMYSGTYNSVDTYTSILNNGTTTWVVGQQNDGSTTFNITALNSTSLSAWTTTLLSNAQYGVASTIGLNNSNAWIIWVNKSYIWNSPGNLVYRNWNGASWDSIKAYTTDYNNYEPNVKANYSQGNCIEFVYMNGTASPYSITYANLSTCTAPADTSPPAYSNIGVNNTNPSILDYVKFYSQWVDNVALSKYIFSWNASGVLCDTWLNDSAVSFSNDWANVTKQIPALCLGKIATIGWRVYVNDTSNNWNSTPITMSFVLPSNSCTYSSGNYFLNCSDRCNFTNTNLNVFGNITIMGSGGWLNILNTNITSNNLYINATNCVTTLSGLSNWYVK